MEEYVTRAIAIGLQELVFLEHMEAGVHYFESTWLTEEDFETLKEQYMHDAVVYLKEIDQLESD